MPDVLGLVVAGSLVNSRAVGDQLRRRYTSCRCQDNGCSKYMRGLEGYMVVSEKIDSYLVS